MDESIEQLPSNSSKTTDSDNLVCFTVFLFVSLLAIALIWCVFSKESSNATIADPNNQKKREIILWCQSGLWTSRYFQYDSWHGPFELWLCVDHLTQMMTGFGTDDVGDYYICGSYSYMANMINLTKNYRRRTGNPFENLGHSVQIQLQWNQRSGQFEGIWRVKTSIYYELQKFELRFK